MYETYNPDACLINKLRSFEFYLPQVSIVHIRCENKAAIFLSI